MGMRKLLLGMKLEGEDLKVNLGMKRLKLLKFAVVEAVVWTANMDRPWVRNWSSEGQCLCWDGKLMQWRLG